MRPIAGERPPAGEAAGRYGSSRLIAAAAWMWVALLVVNGLATAWPEHQVWMRVADLIVLALVGMVAASLTFTPALVITPETIERRWRSAIGWDEVVEILPPGRLGRGVRLRLNDRAVIELPQVEADRREALTALNNVQQTQ